MANLASAYASSAVFPRNLTVPKITPRAKSGSLRGFFLRLLDAIEQSNRRRAEREIAHYLGTHKFTDETEREIERRFVAR
jgi:hypothetical protein